MLSEAGNAAMIFALASIPMATAVGAAVELTRVSNAKEKLDRATDAATLVAKKVQLENRALGISASRALGVDSAQRAFLANSAELNMVATSSSLAITWDQDGGARGTSTAQAQLILGGLLGRSSVPINSLAVVASGTDNYVEIAMVLDNTASMFENDGRPKTRFTLMREAATIFVNGAFDKMTVPDLLRVSVVPFATSVNIKSERPDPWDASAVSGSAVADYGSRVMPNVTIPRSNDIIESNAALTSMFAPVEWRGCIAGNGESQTANDDPNSTMKWNALQVPPFLHMTSWRPVVSTPSTCQSCVPDPNSPPPPPAPPPPPPPGPPPPPPPPGPKGKGKIGLYQSPAFQKQYANLNSGPRSASEARFLTFGSHTNSVNQICTMVPCNVDSCDTSVAWTELTNCWQDSYKGYGPSPMDTGRRSVYVNAATTCGNFGWQTCSSTMNTSTLSACVADPNEIAWNSSGGTWCPWVPTTNWTDFDDSIGPNVNCPMPMLGLSGSRRQVLSTIDRMSPVVGGTHNDVGLRWGLRSLSPRTEWASFFGLPNPKAPRPFNADAKKALVLITDGENTQAQDFPGFWGCSDTGAPGCAGAPDAATLDARMLSWCQAIRQTYKVDIYTVAVNISNPAAVTRLATCAGDPSKAYAVDAADLTKTLENISSKIFQLRLTE